MQRGAVMKREYETVWEIFNECANNQMRDVFIEEITLEESGMEDYIRRRIRDKELTLERTDEGDGSVIFDIDATGIRQRFSFTPI